MLAAVCRTGSLMRIRELSPTTVLVAVSGDVDAATGPALYESIDRELRDYRQLVLDLSQVQFFGTAGYSILHRMQAHCSRSAIDWVVVAGSEVQRLLRLCDPEGILPTAANIVSAVAALTRVPHRTWALGTAARSGRLARSI